MLILVVYEEIWHQIDGETLDNSTHHATMFCHDTVTITKHSHLADKWTRPCPLWKLLLRSRLCPHSIPLRVWMRVTLKAPDLCKCACDEVDVTVVSGGQGLAGCVCWWQRPMFNIHLNRNAIRSLMLSRQIGQRSLSLSSSHQSFCCSSDL